MWLFLCATACSGETPNNEWARVTKRDLVHEVEVTGEFLASDSVAITPPQIKDVWEYKIVYIIEEGESVKPGQKLLEFDTEALERKLVVAETEWNRVGQELKRRIAESQLASEDDRLGLVAAEANAQKQRLKADQPSELVSGLEVKLAALDRELAERELEFRREQSRSKALRDQAEIAILRNKLSKSEQEVQSLRESIAQMTVKSPRAGVVIANSNRNGDKKQIGDSSWRGETLLEVVSFSGLYARGSVDEVYSSQIKAGQPVRLRLDAFPDQLLEGRLRRLHQAIRQEGDSTVMDVDLDLTTTIPSNVRPGMRFRGDVETGRRAAALQVPLDAVFVEARGPVVYVSEQGKPVVRQVELGSRTAKAVEVRSGLKEGERVLRQSAPEEDS